MASRAIVWFRNDLRLHDNEALVEAVSKANEIIPVYVFDERLFNGKTKHGFAKISNHRAKFLIEAVEDLRNSFKSRGGNLVVLTGKTEDVLFEIARKYKTSWIYTNRERTHEEVIVQDALERKLWSIGQEMRYTRGKMLYHTADLPFPISHVPDIFSNFRKEVENIVPIRLPLEIPNKIYFTELEQIDINPIPDLTFWNMKYPEGSSIEIKRFIGGETAAIKQLQYYFWDQNLITKYKETRNESLGWEYSSKFSAWLSAGCISPKYIMAELKKYEKEKVSNESTYWMFFELMWRDFFRFMAKKHGNKIFLPNGINGKNTSVFSKDMRLFKKWATGNTGMPFVDAHMRQLNTTGFMSNRGRQNVASFLVNDLKIHWLLGAEYFESKLIDYDPCSNYGNWIYIAGLGLDPREDRYFNIVSQAKRYDPEGLFIKHWIPELSGLPQHLIFDPNNASTSELAKNGVQIGKSYPLLGVQDTI